VSHKHWFSGLWTHLGPYGPEDIHLHDCIDGKPGDCYEAIAGIGRECSGPRSPHEHVTLTEDGLQPADAIARLRGRVT
jgi:hypothetical protein